MRWVGVLLLAAGCLSPKSQICGDQVCAPEDRCDQASGTCIPAGCGDGAVTGAEECDGAGVPCTRLGFYDEMVTATCSVDCKLDTSACLAFCGNDGLVDGPEMCDGQPRAGQSCLDFGFGVGRLGCSSGCAPSFEGCTEVGLTFRQAFPHAFNAIDGRSPDDVYAVGGLGSIGHFDGTRWTEQGPTAVGAYVALWLDHAGTVAVAAGNDGSGHGVVARYDAYADCGGGAQRCWKQTTIAGADALLGVWGRGPNDIWAVGGASAGFAVHFDGTAWSGPQPLGANSLRAITGDPQTGHLVAVGDAKTTATYDGATWSVVTGACTDCGGGAAYSLLAVTKIDNPTEYIAVGTSPPGFPAVAAHSLDGVSWSALPQSVMNTTLVGLGGVRGDLYAVGSVGVLLRFDGTAFHRIASGTIINLTGVWRASAGDVDVAFSTGELRAIDGAAWADVRQIAGTDQTRLVGAATHGAETIVAENRGYILTTTDGVGWNELPLGDPLKPPPFTGVWIAPTGEAFLSLMSPGTGAYKGLYERLTPADTFQPITATPPSGKATNAIFGLSAQNLFAAGVTGQVFHGTDTTTPWTTATIATSDITAIWGSGPNDVYAVPSDKLLEHSTDGTTWSAVALPANIGALTGVWGAGPSDVFVVGSRGTILHYDGSAWRLQHTGNEAFHGVFGVTRADPQHAGMNLPASDVFAFGGDAVFHYDGVAWSPMALPSLFGALAATVRETADRTDLMFVGTQGNAATLTRPSSASVPETRCTDGWDDDRDGLVDCADPDCASDLACTIRGGACRITGTLTCDSTVAGTTFTGVSRLDTLPMTADLTDGPEAVYRFDAPPGAGSVQVTIDSQRPLDLVVTATHPGTAACDLRAPLAATTGTGAVTFTVSPGKAYAIIVDEPLGSAGDFTLTTACH